MAYWNNLKITGQPGKRQAPKKGASTNHRGMDVIFPDGKVRPEVGGTVFYSGDMDGYGNIVIVQGDDGNFYHYAHNAANRVKKGQRVKPNEVIATMGATGVATGPHTHIEVTDRYGNSLHPQTKKNLGIGGNKLATQGFYPGKWVEIPVQDNNVVTGAASQIQQPQLIDPMQAIQNAYNRGREDVLFTGDLHRANQQALVQNPMYNPQIQSQMADQAIQGIRDEELSNANNQMYEGLVSPEQMLMRAEQMKVQNEAARNAANQNLKALTGEYLNAPTTQDIGQFVDEKARAMDTQAIAANPILQQYYKGMATGQPGGTYQIDPAEYQKRAEFDRAYNHFLNTTAATAALEGNPAANVYANMARTNPSSAQEYVNQAQLDYQANLANQYGVPYEALMQAANKMADYQKAYAPQQMSAYNQAVQQPEMNRRTLLEKGIPAATNMYENTIQANQDYLDVLNKSNANYIKANEPGADVIKKSAEERMGVYGTQPTRAERQYEQLSSSIGQPTTPTIQSLSSLANTQSTDITKGVGNLNTTQADIYGDELKAAAEDYKNRINAYKAQHPTQTKTGKTEEDWRADDLKQMNKILTNPYSMKLDVNNVVSAANYLLDTKRYTNQEIADMLFRRFPGQTEVVKAVLRGENPNQVKKGNRR